MLRGCEISDFFEFFCYFFIFFKINVHLAWTVLPPTPVAACTVQSSISASHAWTVQWTVLPPQPVAARDTCRLAWRTAAGRWSSLSILCGGGPFWHFSGASGLFCQKISSYWRFSCPSSQTGSMQGCDNWLLNQLTTFFLYNCYPWLIRGCLVLGHRLPSQILAFAILVAC